MFSVSVRLCFVRWQGIHCFGSTRRLEQLFDKYEISADMTYTILTSFNSLTTFVVTTSYNIALPIIKSTFEMNLTLDAKSATAIRGCVSPKAAFRRSLLRDVCFLLPHLLPCHFRSRKLDWLNMVPEGQYYRMRATPFETALKTWHFGIYLVCWDSLFVES